MKKLLLGLLLSCSLSYSTHACDSYQSLEDAARSLEYMLATMDRGDFDINQSHNCMAMIEYFWIRFDQACADCRHVVKRKTHKHIRKIRRYLNEY